MTTISITRDTLPDLSKGGAHKYDAGHALVISGGPHKTGAARLAARGALRIGAGLVTLACPLRAMPEVAGHVTAIMLKGLDGPSGLAEILEDTRFNAICLGPGMGLGQITANLAQVALESGRACVLDADALSRFQRKPEVLFGLLHDKAVLTPHGGEFARLFPDLAQVLKDADDALEVKTEVAKQAAARSGAIVLFKGVETVIANPAGRVAVHSATGARAVPWLGTAGAGDVLSGFVTGLMARGHAPMVAAEAATWLHVECARIFGPGLIAEDLPEQLPKAFRDVVSP
ncbi:NAD(P)H-hydrate dehydratase [Aliishimia ponticola]|uniref:NAD(P)H-hydrate dehydratase n=1 Tax=Aliishimia ponticola TaxID=2499833 RepID=UPI0026CF3A5A